MSEIAVFANYRSPMAVQSRENSMKVLFCIAFLSAATIGAAQSRPVSANAIRGCEIICFCNSLDVGPEAIIRFDNNGQIPVAARPGATRERYTAVSQSGNGHRPLVWVSGQLSAQLPKQRRPEEDEESSRIQKNNAQRANKQRQLQLMRDTDKLVKLTNELKQYVDKTNENILSLEVIRKAEEIERLAKSVKEKMRGYN